jgi:hypothetical protein
MLLGMLMLAMLTPTTWADQDDDDDEVVLRNGDNELVVRHGGEVVIRQDGVHLEVRPGSVHVQTNQGSVNLVVQSNQGGPVVIGPRPDDDLRLQLRSGLAAAGRRDPSVTVAGPGVEDGARAIVCSSRPSIWGVPPIASAWISGWADCDEDRPSGDFRYTIKFTLPDEIDDPRLTGRVLSDNRLDIELNGASIFSGESSFRLPVTFGTSEKAHFKTGENTLVYRVHNNGGPTGLAFSARVTAEGEADSEEHAWWDNRGRCAAAITGNASFGPSWVHDIVTRAIEQACRD